MVLSYARVVTVTQNEGDASKKTRWGVNEDCERLERDLKGKHETEMKEITGGPAEGEEEEIASEVVGKESMVRAARAIL